MSNANIPFFVKVATDLFVGMEINKDGPDKVVANATLTIAVAQAAVTGAGDPSTILPAIDAALAASTADPAKQAAILTIVNWIGARAVAIQTFLSGTLAASAATALLVSAANEAIAVATKYLPTQTK